jgi:hypothetical protein
MKYEVLYNDNDGYGWTSDLVTGNWQEALSAWSDNFCSYDSKAFNKIRVRTPENIAYDLQTTEQMEVHSSYLKYQDEVNNRVEQRIAKDEYMTNIGTFDIVHLDNSKLTHTHNSQLGMNADQTPQPRFWELESVLDAAKKVEEEEYDTMAELAKLDISYDGPRQEPLYPSWEIDEVLAVMDEDVSENDLLGLSGNITDFHGDFDKMSEAEQDAIINPKHYKMLSPEVMAMYPHGMEYIDLMAYLLEGHTGVQAHLLGQIYKYSMRLGKKDNTLQDARKIEWYASRLVSEIEQS